MGPVSEQLDKGNLRNEDHVNGELPPVRLRSGDKPTNTQMSGVLLPLRSGVAERLTLVDKMAQTSSAMGFDFPGSSRKFLGRRVATNKSGKSLLPSLSSKSTKEAALIQENHGESPKINEPTTPKRERSNPNNHDEWMTTELFLSKVHSTSVQLLLVKFTYQPYTIWELFLQLPVYGSDEFSKDQLFQTFFSSFAVPFHVASIKNNQSSDVCGRDGIGSLFERRDRGTNR